MWYELLLYNPIVWRFIFWVVVTLFSYGYWYCKTNFRLEGSWKKLDKSIHFKK